MSSLSLSSSHLRNFSQALTSLKLPSSLSPSHLKLTISQAQALKLTPSQPKLDPPPSQLSIASVLARRSVLLCKNHAGISVASPDPCRHQSCSPDPRWHQSCFTRPTPPIGVLARRSGGFLVIFYFVWSGFYEKN